MSNKIARQFDANELVIATHNQGKITEINARLSAENLDVRLFSAGELKLDEPEENGVSFTENAAIKALAAAKACGKVALADDSGLSVTALNGAPGIYSARWAGAEKDFKTAMARVNMELNDSHDRSAAFICAMALAWPDGHIETVEGRCEGEIIWPVRGGGGFGYDPIFKPIGHEITFGEMNFADKQEISHRKAALDQIFEKCFNQ